MEELNFVHRNIHTAQPRSSITVRYLCKNFAASALVLPPCAQCHCGSLVGYLEHCE